MIEQLSIFAENKKGTMREITELLADADINIIALVTNDSAEFGIVRMLVTDCQKAYEILRGAGYMCHTDQVIGVNIADNPGSLSNLLGTVYSSNINIEYLYISYDREAATPIAILKAQSEDEVEECLEGRGYTLL